MPGRRCSRGRRSFSRGFRGAGGSDPLDLRSLTLLRTSAPGRSAHFHGGASENWQIGDPSSNGRRVTRSPTMREGGRVAAWCSWVSTRRNRRAPLPRDGDETRRAIDAFEVAQLVAQERSVPRSPACPPRPRLYSSPCIAYEIMWCRRSDSNRHGVAPTGF